MFQKTCSTCGKPLPTKLVSFDLIQCYPCYLEWKKKNTNSTIIKVLDVDYELANKNSNQSIKKIEDVDLSEFL